MKIKPGQEEAYAHYVKVNSDDSYSRAVVDYGEAWADAMEAKIASGTKLEEIAEETSLAIDMGITGFMYGCAVSALAKFWEHGEALRCWHNLDTQIHDEGERANKTGGVLNPAILTVGE